MDPFQTMWILYYTLDPPLHLPIFPGSPGSCLHFWILLAHLDTLTHCICPIPDPSPDPPLFPGSSLSTVSGPSTPGSTLPTASALFQIHPRILLYSLDPQYLLNDYGLTNTMCD